MNYQDAIKYAPEIRLHHDEEYFPMDPMDFIRASRFRHHRGWGRDDGYNKVRRSWLRNNSKSTAYYNIPLSVITQYRVHDGNKNRRPRDKNSGNSWNVFLQPDEKPVGESNPNNRVPVFYYIKKWYKSPPFRHYWAISYWYFFGYNDGWGGFNHQGDWEHITILFELDKRLSGVYMAAHGQPKFYRKEQVNWNGTHPIVYCAKGSHATYNRVGSFHTVFRVDQTSNNGCHWRTWLNCDPLHLQPWRHFAGAWGEVGEQADTTGPLGPWQKRRKV